MSVPSHEMLRQEDTPISEGHPPPAPPIESWVKWEEQQKKRNHVLDPKLIKIQKEHKGQELVVRLTEYEAELGLEKKKLESDFEEKTTKKVKSEEELARITGVLNTLASTIRKTEQEEEFIKKITDEDKRESIRGIHEKVLKNIRGEHAELSEAKIRLERMIAEFKSDSVSTAEARDICSKKWSAVRVALKSVLKTASKASVKPTRECSSDKPQKGRSPYELELYEESELFSLFDPVRALKANKEVPYTAYEIFLLKYALLTPEKIIDDDPLFELSQIFSWALGCKLNGGNKVYKDDTRLGPKPREMIRCILGYDILTEYRRREEAKRLESARIKEEAHRKLAELNKDAEQPAVAVEVMVEDEPITLDEIPDVDEKVGSRPSQETPKRVLRKQRDELAKELEAQRLISASFEQQLAESRRISTISVALSPKRGAKLSSLPPSLTPLPSNDEEETDDFIRRVDPQTDGRLQAELKEVIEERARLREALELSRAREIAARAEAEKVKAAQAGIRKALDQKVENIAPQRISLARSLGFE